MKDPAVWRLEQLLAAGYPIELAEQLAAAKYVDLHDAIELVQKTSPATAAEILL